MNPKPASTSGRRAKDKTTLTISLPKELKEAIELAAEEESRSMSNYLVLELTKLMQATAEARRSGKDVKRIPARPLRNHDHGIKLTA